MDNEKLINTSPEPVTVEGTEKRLNQMNKCVCKIYNKCEGTGFFTKIPFNNILLPVLITNNHVLGENDIKKNNIIILSLNYDKKKKIIEINNERKKYINEELDITIIEIKPNKDNINNEYIDLDDDIIECINDNKRNVNYLNEIYLNKSIYILHYPKGNNIVVSYGKPPEFDNIDIKHKCSTEHGSSGSPILLINNQKLIGIHYGSYRMEEYNKGTLIIYSIIEFQKKNNNKNINDNKIKDNYIISEFEIKKDNETIRIINSYEEAKRGHNWSDKGNKYHNEKVIKENCEIRINNEIILFSYKYRFNKKGKYTIKYIFKNNITNTNCLFCECKCLVNINLSNFNTQNVTDMSCMFLGCSSLTNINLSNFNTQNVTNMDGIFDGCSSLININLSNFNTLNVTDMSCMFKGCSSLTNINLSNFNTQNVTDMSGMFYGCSSLININLSNFNTQNVTHMAFMFKRCSSLTNINLSNFNTQNVTHMAFIFEGCKCLKKENIIINNKDILNEFNKHHK